MVCLPLIFPLSVEKENSKKVACNYAQRSKYVNFTSVLFLSRLFEKKHLLNFMVKCEVLLT